MKNIELQSYTQGIMTETIFAMLRFKSICLQSAGCSFKGFVLWFSLFPLWITNSHLLGRWTVFLPFICCFFVFLCMCMEHERMETGDKH